MSIQAAPHDEQTPLLAPERNSADADDVPIEYYEGFSPLFGWLYPLLRRGYRRPLATDDLGLLPECDRPEVVAPVFTRRAAEPLWRVVHTEWRRDIVVSGLCMLVASLTMFVGPIAVSELLSFIERRDDPDAAGDGESWLEGIPFREESWYGYLVVGCMALSAVITTVSAHNHHNIVVRLATRVKTGLAGCVYRKAMRMTQGAKLDSSTGEVINLMSVDATRVFDFLLFFHHVWSAPLQVSVAMSLLWQFVGVSALAGLAVLVTIIPIQSRLVVAMARVRREAITLGDVRIRDVEELLAAIRVLKAYAWERAFAQRVAKVHGEELVLYLRVGVLRALNSLLLQAAPVLVSVTTWAFYANVFENELTPERVFASLTIFGLIKPAIWSIPTVVTTGIDAYVSACRINAFLERDEVSGAAGGGPDDPPPQKAAAPTPTGIEIRNASFGWRGAPGPAVQALSLTVQPGQLCIVTGPVGAGKSTLLQALFGETETWGDGAVAVRGTTAYVAQQAWIQNASLRNNILFGRPWDPVRYRTVVDACALRADLAQLPAGDQTEIGERGVTLSGGQRQRVSLARAVYHDADVMVLDDVLAAVDAHVGKHIFDHLLGPQGLLRSKVVVFATHQTAYVPDADLHLALSGSGAVVHCGPPAEGLRQADDSADGSDRDNEQDGGKAGKNDFGEEGAFSGASKLTEDEDREIGSVDRQVYWTYIKACGVGIASVLLSLFVVRQTIDVLTDYWLSLWSTDSYERGAGFYLTVYGSLSGGAVALRAVALLVFVVAGIRTARVLHNGMLDALMLAPVSLYDVTPTGRITNRFSSDIMVVDQVLPTTLQMLLTNAFVLVGVVSLNVAAFPIFLAPLALLIALYRQLFAFYVSSSRELKRLSSISKSPMYSFFGETLEGLVTVRAYGAQAVARFITRSDKLIGAHSQVFLFEQTLNRWLGVRLESVGTGMVLAMGMIVATTKGIDPGLAGLTLAYALSITNSLNWTVRHLADLEAQMCAVERIGYFSSVDAEIDHDDGDRVPSDWPSAGRIEFDKIVARYRPELPDVLRGLSLTIAAGQKVGIVGRTGSGKSSMLLVVLRILRLRAGRVLVDGVDIDTISAHTLRSRLAFIPQDPALFGGSMRFNLDPVGAHSDEAIWTALDKAHLGDHVRARGGLEAACQRDSLSVGQRQLLCMARALLRQSRVLCIDEATASLDHDTDAAIQKMLRTEFRHATVLTIAHRLQTVLDSDQILVLGAGKILEVDEPARLLEREGGVLREMVRAARATGRFD